jgi:hypothetical protein
MVLNQFREDKKISKKKKEKERKTIIYPQSFTQIIILLLKQKINKNLQ